MPKIKKMLKYLIGLGVPLFLSVTIIRAFTSYNGFIINRIMTYSENVIIPTDQFDQLSLVAAVSTPTLANVPFNDGYVSSGSIRVSSYSALNYQMVAYGDISLIGGVDFSTSTSNGDTACSISSAIMNSSKFLVNGSRLLNSTCTWATGIVFASANVVGIANNFYVFSSTPAAVSTYTFVGGSNPMISTVTDVVTTTWTIPMVNGFTVLFTTVAGSTPPVPLKANTTYYTVLVDQNHFGLSDTSTGSAAGLKLDLSPWTSNTFGANSFVVAPTSYTGPFGFDFMVSNDSNNWVALFPTISSMTYISSTTYRWDFGQVNYKYLRTRVNGATRGGVQVILSACGKLIGIKQ